RQQPPSDQAAENTNDDVAYQPVTAAWNERQALRAPMIFSPTIGAAIRAGYWFLWVRCPACRTINANDLRTLDRHHDAAVTSSIPALSCRSCRPNAPFAELARLSRTSIATKCARSKGGGCLGSREERDRHSFSGSFALFAAIRRASSFVSSLA